MRTRAELKTEAKNLLRANSSSVMSSKNFWMVFLCLVLSVVVSMINAYMQFNDGSSIVKLICSIVLSPMLILSLVNTLRAIYEKGNTNVSNIFEVFTVGSNYKIILINLLYGFIVGIGTILLIVPGVIFAYRYSQVYRIFNEDSSQGIWECFKKSSKLMKGHKFEYFVLQISFILWYLLGIVTLGIAGIYSIPYQYMTSYVYYKELRLEKEI